VDLKKEDEEDQPVLALHGLSSGDYWIVATLQATNEFKEGVLIQCELEAGADNDVRDFEIDDATAGTETGVMQVVHEFTKGGESATVACHGIDDLFPLTVSHIKITAIPVGELTNTPS